MRSRTSSATTASRCGALGARSAFTDYLKPLRQIEWIVYAKRPFSGPQAVLAYLSLYTHRVAISNRRLLHYDGNTVTVKWKNYRANGRYRHKTMTLQATELMRRFIIHVLPPRFHRIRHFGLFANHQRRLMLRTLRQSLDVFEPPEPVDASAHPPSFVCRACGSPLIIAERFDRPQRTRALP